MSDDQVSGEQGGSDATWRGIVAAILGVLAVIAITMTAITIWANRTVFDSDEVADIVASALAEPDVQAGLADRITEEVFAAVDVEGAVETVLPARLDRFGPVLADGARTAVDRTLTRLLSEPETQQLLTTLVERAHGRAMDLLQGDGLVDGVSVQDGTVTLNLLPLIGRGLERLQGLGLFDDLVVPEMTADGDPAEQIAALEDATGRDLRDDFGQLSVYSSERVADAEASVRSAQQLVAVAKRSTWLLVLLFVVFTAAAVAVARDRWLAALALGLGGVIAMSLTRSIVQRVVDDAPDLVARSGAKAALDAMLTEATGGLLRLAAVMLLVAAVVAVVGLWRRGWRSDDLLVAGATVLGVVVSAIAGFSLVSLLLALVIAVGGYFLASRWLLAEPSPSITGS